VCSAVVRPVIGPNAVRVLCHPVRRADVRLRRSPHCGVACARGYCDPFLSPYLSPFSYETSESQNPRVCVACPNSGEVR